MARRTLNRHELRAEAEAAEARGLTSSAESRSRSAPKEKSEPARKSKAAAAAPRMRVLWAVCDVGGRTVVSYDYSDKALAEEHVAKLKAAGKGMHFVRSIKEPIPSSAQRNER
jgi:hypothetical protein